VETLITRANLAVWRGRAGDPVAAATALAELLVDERRLLGAGHPEVVKSESNLAYWRERANE
jgi:hypothetical protein